MKKNMILIALDTLRKDRLSLFGHHRDTSPFLSRLAERSVNFVNAFANSAWTPPTHASLLTGLLPWKHGVDGDTTNLSPDLPFLFTILKQNGYRTSSVVVNPYLLSEKGFMRDIDFPIEIARHKKSRFDRILYLRIVNKLFRRYESLDNKIIVEHCKKSVERLKTFPEPFGLFFNLTQVHSRYAPPKRFLDRLTSDAGALIASPDWDRIRFISDRGGLKNMALQALPQSNVIEGAKLLYDGEIRCLDHLLKNFFSFLQKQNLLSNTVIILLSDHGENFGENGLFYHQFALNPSLIEIPFLWVDPDLKPGNVQTPVSQIDVLPTLINSLGLKGEFSLDGKNIFGLREDEDREIQGSYKPSSDVLGLIKKFGGSRERITELDKFYAFIRTTKKHVEMVAGESNMTLYEYKRPCVSRKELTDLQEKEYYLQRFRDLYPGARIHSYGRSDQALDVDDKTREQLESLGYM